MSATSLDEAFFGWDLLYKTVEPDLKKKSDILILLSHFLLIKQSKYRCLGVGEDKTIGENEVGSELLPTGWNEVGEKYSLRYASNNDLYLLLGHSIGDSLIINLLDVKNKKVSNIALEPEEAIKQLKGNINQILANKVELVASLRSELLEPVFTGTAKEMSTQTNDEPSSSRRNVVDPLRIGEPRYGPGRYMPPGGIIDPFPILGRSDLDPFGRLGSGNLLGFPNRPTFQGQPRFDPFGPDDPSLPRNPNSNPNPDHFQPPNFGGHDYYM